MHSDTPDGLCRGNIKARPRCAGCIYSFVIRAQQDHSTDVARKINSRKASRQGKRAGATEKSGQQHGKSEGKPARLASSKRTKGTVQRTAAGLGRSVVK